jgi:protein gp37
MTGCIKLSAGCDNCYAERMAKRLKAMGQKKYVNEFKPTFHPEEITRPFEWVKPCKIFVCSMSDLFNNHFDDCYINLVLNVIKDCPQHEFQILTKRPTRMAEFSRKYKFSNNIIAGTTIENLDEMKRVYSLKQTLSCLKFVSFEPLLEDVTANVSAPNISDALDGIDWVIVGSETGPNARPMKLDWARRLRDICYTKRIPFFYKHGPDGPLLDGELYNNYPLINLEYNKNG